MKRRLLDWLRSLLSRPPRQQTCWAFCPGCSADLCSQVGALVSDDADGVVFACQCGQRSLWCLDAPVPLLLRHLAEAKTVKRLHRTLTVQAGAALGLGLALEVLSRVLDRWDLVADVTSDVMRYGGQGIAAVAVPALAVGIRRALGGGK